MIKFIIFQQLKPLVQSVIQQNSKQYSKYINTKTVFHKERL